MPAFRQTTPRRGRASESTRNLQTDSREIRSERAPQDDRASGRRKKNSAMTSAKNNSPEPSNVMTQYETLRSAALGEALPPEARAGLMLFLRRGLWGWARVM